MRQFHNSRNARLIECINPSQTKSEGVGKTCRASDTSSPAKSLSDFHSREVEEELAELCRLLEEGIEVTDKHMQVLDGYCIQLNRIGYLHRSIVVGPIVLRRSYGLDGPDDSGQLVQAALTTDFGSAAIFWDSEDYCDADRSGDFERIAMESAVPLCKCEIAIRSLVYPKIPNLVALLLESHKMV